MNTENFPGSALPGRQNRELDKCDSPQASGKKFYSPLTFEMTCMLIYPAIARGGRLRGHVYYIGQECFYNRPSGSDRYESRAQRKELQLTIFSDSGFVI
jgi:hypothetical protein